MNYPGVSFDTKDNLFHGDRKKLPHLFALLGVVGGASTKHRHAKRAGVIFSIDWVAWGKTGC